MAEFFRGRSTLCVALAKSAAFFSHQGALGFHLTESTSSAVRCASALSRHPDAAAAVEQAVQEALAQLVAVPDLVLCFFSAEHVAAAATIAQRLVELTGTQNVLGCSAESIVGTKTEIEFEPALVVWMARLPQTQLVPMQLQYQRTPEGGTFIGWPAELPLNWPRSSTLLLLGEPFTFPADVLLERLNEDQPGVPVVGGMASAGHQPGQNRLIIGDQAVDRGAVALLLDGGIQIEVVVSQGCRPIGQPYVVTKAERNLIYELGGVPAYRRLEELFYTLPTREQQLVQRGLHVGRVVSEYLEQFEQGDFLIRNVVGLDRQASAIAIADFVRVGQTVQFQVRDAETATADLKQLLKKHAERCQPRGGLLFTCNGRGTRMFTEPHHDAGVFAEQFGALPLAGFFAAGELGPVSKHNFLHGFTASIALFS